MRKTLFTIDGIEGIFEGYTDGRHWNGWACPYFTKKVADEIMRVNNESYCGVAYQMHYDESQDAFIREEPEYDEPYIVQGYDVDGMHLYPIGNACWIWDDLADCQSEQSKMVMEYLREEYHYLDCEKLYECYYGIIQEIDGYMTDKEVKIFADGFMTAFDRSKK